MNYDSDLLQLQQKVLQKKRLTAKLQELRKQRRIFDQKIIELRVAHRSEQQDVEKLEGKSLANYFYLVTGKLDGMLTEERRQAAAAKVKLDAAERELSSIDLQIRSVQTQLNELHGCDELYASALNQKYTELKGSDSPAGIDILKAEETIAFLKSQKAELKEAYDAGRRAMGTTNRIQSNLTDAGHMNTWDILGADGPIPHTIKYLQLDEAQDLVEVLQGQLREFKTELADVNIQANLQVNINGFLRFADFFFDGLLADLSVGKRIREAESSVGSLQVQIRHALSKLRDMEKQLDTEIALEKARIENIIIESR